MKSPAQSPQPCFRFIYFSWIRFWIYVCILVFLEFPVLAEVAHGTEVGVAFGGNEAVETPFPAVGGWVLAVSFVIRNTVAYFFLIYICTRRPQSTLSSFGPNTCSSSVNGIALNYPSCTTVSQGACLNMSFLISDFILLYFPNSNYTLHLNLYI
jgi:hypothetical protein